MWGDPLTIAVSQFMLVSVLLVAIVILTFQIRKIKSLLNRLSKGSRKENLNELLERILEENALITKRYGELQKEMNRVMHEMKSKKSNVGMIRFNAFDLEGNRLSFSIAFLDDFSNGYVLTSIYGREESRIYAKPIVEGQSSHNLSAEEEEAVRVAVKSHK
jgi:hypothetical protein